MTAAIALIGGARRVLIVGVGGGGDVAGAVSVAELAQAAGTPSVLGGLTWERRPVDPIPGPRLLSEIQGAEPIDAVCALAGPDTSGPGGFLFAESRVAGFLGAPVLLVDPNRGPARIARGLHAAADLLGCDCVVLVDIGGDILAHGDEPGLGSPLADAVLLAAGAALQATSDLVVLGAVFGAGCDGELTPQEVAQRLAHIRAAGAHRGEATLGPAQLDRLAGAVGAVETEASAMALRAARGERGTVTIRDGRRTVSLTADAAVVHFFDPAAAIAAGAAPLARLVADATDLIDADVILRGHGVKTELGYERSMGSDPTAAVGGHADDGG